MLKYYEEWSLFQFNKNLNTAPSTEYRSVFCETNNRNNFFKYWIFQDNHLDIYGVLNLKLL